jgi:GNAT superfamily N-acetyltransferase
MTLPPIDRPLARRLETCSTMRSVNYARAYGRLHPGSGSDVLPVGGGYAVFADANSPVNRALGLGMDGAVSPEDLALADDFFRARGVKPRLEICPLADGSLLDSARLYDYRPDFFFTVLARTVGAEPAPPEANPDIRVTQVQADESALWLRVVAQGFTGEEEPGEEDYAILAPNYHGDTSSCFMAWIDGEPAGGGAMAVYGGVAEFGGASTLPRFRRRGVQTALLQARLEECRRQGVDLAMVLTTPGSDSQHNIERAGFRVAYTKLVVSAVK